MTAQISDGVVYQNLAYSIAGIKGSGLFDPVEHGLDPCGSTTACWRGYFCTYEVIDSAFYLTKLNIGLDTQNSGAVAQGTGPKLFGRAIRRNIEHSYRKRMWPFKPISRSWEEDFVVDDFKELVPFTGGLLLGRDFINKMYVHSGFHPAYKFRTVHELIFDSGHLVSEHDRSASMDAYRKAWDGRNPSSQVEGRFSRDYMPDYE